MFTELNVGNQLHVFCSLVEGLNECVVVQIRDEVRSVGVRLSYRNQRMSVWSQVLTKKTRGGTKRYIVVPHS